MIEPIYVELLHKNVEKNYMYVAYYGVGYTNGTNGSFDLKDFEEKTGIIWGEKGVSKDYDINGYIPKLVMSYKLFKSIKVGV